MYSNLKYFWGHGSYKTEGENQIMGMYLDSTGNRFIYCESKMVELRKTNQKRMQIQKQIPF